MIIKQIFSRPSGILEALIMENSDFTVADALMCYVSEFL